MRAWLIPLALLTCAPVLATPSSPTISLRSSQIQVEESSTRASSAPGTVRWVRFAGPPTVRQLEALDASVDRVFAYLPDHAFLVRTRSDGAGSSLADLPASWNGPWLPEYKLAPEISDVERSASIDGRRRMVLLHLFPDRPLEETRARVEALIESRLPETSGVVGESRIVGASEKARFSRIRLLLTEPEIAALRDDLASLDEVFWIEREHRRTLKNDESIWVGQSGTSGGGATPIFDQGLRGEGQIVGVLDTGVDIDSCYFWDAANGLPAVNACDGGTAVDLDQRKVLAVDFLWSGECNGGLTASEWDNQGHGSHVAGSVAGDDFAMPGIHNGSDGMAPAAKLIIQDCGFQTNDCADCPGIGCPVVDLNPVFQQPYDQGARIHTNSWGDEENDLAYGEYTAGSEDADEFMWDHPDVLLLFAAGNNGGTFNTVDSPSTAKNVVSVGATGPGLSADSIAGFSSKGPTDDGRIKPDVTAPGQSIDSAATDFDITTSNCSDVSNSGTSMATPTVAGYAALVRQYLTEGFYPTGTATPGDAIAAPSGALIKALLINSGTTMTGEGTIPNDVQGWGRVLLDDSLYFDGETRGLWLTEEAGFSRGAPSTPTYFPLTVTSDTEPLEVTLVWTDAPSTPAAGTNLVNDLDLRVIGPDGAYLGNVFDGGSSIQGGTPDRLNNVEVVRIEVPTAGTWVLEVSPHSIPIGPQPFALVATGAVAGCGGEADAVPLGPTAAVLVGGDEDPFLDNCEGASFSFLVVNPGSSAATNAAVSAVSSPSHPETVFGGGLWSSPSLAACSVDATPSIDVTTAKGLIHDDTFQVDVEVSRDGTPSTRTATFQLASTETDLQTTALEWSFDTDLGGWMLTSGTFGRSDAIGGAEGTDWYLQSSASQPDACDVIRSPPLQLTATSTLSLFSHYEVEGGGGGSPWYDRANVGTVHQGIRTVVEPDGGRPYDVPDGAENGTCGTGGQAGWAGSHPTWAESTWSASALASASLDGEEIQLEIRYGTDGGLHLNGVRIDSLSVNDAAIPVPDAQADVCIPGYLFADDFESGDTAAWSP